MTSASVVLIFLSLSYSLPICNGLSSMAIDLGTDFTKVAVVRPGLPMEIALDSSSKRVIPTIVVLKEGNRLFGNGAVASMTRDPKIVFAELPSIIGKTLDHPSVVAYRKRYPYHNMVFSPEYGQLAFIVDGKEITVETLIAMFLNYVRQVAEAFAESEMKTAVITVPSYFSQAERRALLRAASLANIGVIQLMDDNLAVALDFIRPRVKTIDDKSFYAFFDVGAASTTATIVSYQMSKAKGDSIGEHPHVFIIGAASDTSLGTNVFVDRLQEHLINKFKEMHKVDIDVTKNARAIAKFRKETSRVFKILSANKDIQALVEEVYEGLDLRVKVSRDELEDMCKDLLERIPSVLHAALKIAENFSSSIANDLREIIIFGGGTRIPAIQAALLSGSNKEVLGKGINSDEAAAMGAVHQAASNTHGFLVKRFILRDLSRYPLAVTFPRINDTNDSTEEELVTKILFPANNPFPQKRTVKFPRLEKDVAFQIHYGEAPADLSNYLCGDNTFMKVNISGVKEEIEKFRKGGHEPQAVRAHLELDASGILKLSEVNLIMVHGSSENKTDDSKSTIERLTDGISSFFGSGDKKSNEGRDVKPHSTEAPSTPSEQPESENNTQSTGSTTLGTESADILATSPPTKIMIHPLPFHVQILDLVNPPSESVGASMAILREFDAADKERDLLNEAKNELERTIYDTLREIKHGFDNHTTKEEMESLSATANEISQWYDDEGHFAPRSAIEEQLEKLGEAVDPFKRRVKAFAELPRALTSLDAVLTNQAEAIEIIMRANSVAHPLIASEYIQTLNESFTKEEEDRKVGLPIYSLEEVETMRKLIADTKTWSEEMKTALATCDNQADPPVHLVTVTERTAALVAKLEYFGHKGETWFTTYKRLFDIKKVLLDEAAKKAQAEANASSAINVTATNETVIVSPEAEDQVAEEQPKPEQPSDVQEPESNLLRRIGF